MGCGQLSRGIADARKPGPIAGGHRNTSRPTRAALGGWAGEGERGADAWLSRGKRETSALRCCRVGLRARRTARPSPSLIVLSRGRRRYRRHHLAAPGPHHRKARRDSAPFVEPRWTQVSPMPPARGLARPALTRAPLGHRRRSPWFALSFRVTSPGLASACGNCVVLSQPLQLLAVGFEARGSAPCVVITVLLALRGFGRPSSCRSSAAWWHGIAARYWRAAATPSAAPQSPHRDFRLRTSRKRPTLPCPRSSPRTSSGMALQYDQSWHRGICARLGSPIKNTLLAARTRSFDVAKLRKAAIHNRQVDHSRHTAPPRLHQPDINQHQADPAARQGPEGRAAARCGPVRPLAHPDLHCRPALPWLTAPSLIEGALHRVPSTSTSRRSSLPPCRQATSSSSTT